MAKSTAGRKFVLMLRAIRDTALFAWRVFIRPIERHAAALWKAITDDWIAVVKQAVTKGLLWITALGGVVVVVVVVAVIWQTAHSESVIINAITVTKEIEELGYSSGLVTAQITDRILEISNEATTSVSRGGVVPIADIPNLELSESKISVAQVITFAQRFLKMPVREVGGDMFLKNKQPVLLLRTSLGSRAKSFRIPAEGEAASLTGDQVVQAAAEHFWEFYQPLILASYLDAKLRTDAIADPANREKKEFKDRLTRVWDLIRSCLANDDKDDDGRAINLAGVLFEVYDQDDVSAHAMFEAAQDIPRARIVGLVNATDLDYTAATRMPKDEARAKKTELIGKLRPLLAQQYVPTALFRNLARYESDPDIANYDDALLNIQAAIDRVATSNRKSDRREKASLYAIAGKIYESKQQSDKARQMYALSLILDPTDPLQLKQKLFMQPATAQPSDTTPDDGY